MPLYSRKCSYMKGIDKINSLIGKYMAVLIIAAAALALFLPASGTWIDTGWINYLLMVVMLGMGLTLDFRDFSVVFTRPKDILLGCAAQFTIMPLIAFLLSKAFSLDAALTAGVILVGTCPGGTSSNVITYLSKGDVALFGGKVAQNILDVYEGIVIAFGPEYGIYVVRIATFDNILRQGECLAFNAGIYILRAVQIPYKLSHGTIHIFCDAIQLIRFKFDGAFQAKFPDCT